MSARFHEPFLAQLGWCVHFQQQWDALIEQDRVDPQWTPGRIVREERGRFLVQFSEEDTRAAQVSGRFRYRAEGADGSERRDAWPAAGDWALCGLGDGQAQAIIHRVFDRKTALLRKEAGERSELQVLGANIDVVLIATSANQDFNPRRLERYLAMVWESGAQPVILLTKADLVSSPEELSLELENLFPGVAVHAISVANRKGLEALDAYRQEGRTLALIGSSGVGKSTLANHLLGREVLAVREIRTSDDRGKHTTTGRHLLLLPGGGLLMDTPGIRELHLGGHDEGVSQVFDDIEALAAQCRFSDCAHESEPGCALREAIEEGQIGEDRWFAYQKLRREVEHQEIRQDKAAARRERDRWKKIHVQAAAHAKRKRWES